MQPLQIEKGGEKIEIRLEEYNPTRDYLLLRDNLRRAGVFEPRWDSHESLTLLSSQKTNRIIVARYQSLIVGSIIVTTAGNWAYLWRLAVLPEWRKLGIATALMREAESWLKGRGINEVALFAKKDLSIFYEKRDWHQLKIPSYICWIKAIQR